VDAVFHGKLSRLADGYQKLPSDKSLYIFEESSDARKNLAALVEAVFIPLHSEIRIPVSDINKLMQNILLWSVRQANNDLQRDAAWHILSIIVNKRANDVLQFLSYARETVWPTEVLDTTKSTSSRHTTVRAFAWLTKGLVIKGHPLSVSFRDALFEAVQDEEIGWTAAKAIGGIVATDNILTKKNRATVKVKNPLQV